MKCEDDQSFIFLCFSLILDSIGHSSSSYMMPSTRWVSRPTRIKFKNQPKFPFTMPDLQQNDVSPRLPSVDFGERMFHMSSFLTVIHTRTTFKSVFRKVLIFILQVVIFWARVVEPEPINLWVPVHIAIFPVYYHYVKMLMVCANTEPVNVQNWKH
jgi:hypothetical protein